MNNIKSNKFKDINDNDSFVTTVQLNVGEETKIPTPPPFSKFPFFHIINVIKDDVKISTEYYPNSKSIPSTRHPKTIRLINLDFSKIKAKVEYDAVSKSIKFIEGNVDTIVIKIIV